MQAHRKLGFRRIAASFFGALVLFAPAQGWAQCSRPIVVPAAPTGFSVMVESGLVRGIYPDWLRAVGRRIGCTFEFPVVPRARADHMFFEQHSADILTPASQTRERDARAEFVHFYGLTPALITHQSVRGEIPRDVTALLTDTKWRAALVRRYSFGDEYQALLRELEASGRVDFVSDLETVERMLRSGRVEFSILPASLMYSALLDGQAAQGAGEFRYHELRGLSPIRSGAYLSLRSLPPQDRELLRDALSKAARDGSFRKAHEPHLPESVLKTDRFLGN